MNTPTIENTKFDTQIFERWFHRIFSHWHWFAIATLLAVGGSVLYLRYTTTYYSCSAAVLVKDNSQNINPFETRNYNYDPSGGRSVNLTNEIKVFHSRKLIEETVSKMPWQVSYYIEGNIKKTEQYRFSLFNLLFDDSLKNIPHGVEFQLKATTDPNYFELNIVNPNSSDPLPEYRQYRFNTPIQWKGFIFQIRKDSTVYLDPKVSYSFKIHRMQEIINEFQTKLRIIQYDKSSSVLTLSTIGSSPEKEMDFLNLHAQTFIKNSLTEKNASHERSINFIESQLRNLVDTLSELESKMILFRKKFNSSNVETLAEKRFLKLEVLEEERAKILLNIHYLEYLEKYITERNSYQDIVAPAGVGITDPLLSNLVAQLIELKLKQNIAFKTDPQSPFRLENEKQINQVKKTLFEVISNLKNTNKILITDLDSRINKINLLTNKLLENERKYIELKRKYKINEELHNLLLKKKSEMSIVKAGNVSDTKLLDSATITGIPSPNKSRVYLIAFFVGLVLPLGLVILKYIAKYRVMEKEDVLAVCPMPFLGTIGHLTEDDHMAVFNKPRSIIAEEFRSIRANISFFLPTTSQNVLVITSSLSGEGKTFTSSNLAGIIAASGKKVVLVGADLRKPKIYLPSQNPSHSGLSTYLSGRADVSDIIQSTQIPHLSFIPSGPIPPNPSELLISEKLDLLIHELKIQFDLIVFDTPPLGLVSDAMSIIKYSQAVIYVIRHNYTQTRYLKELNEYIVSGKIKNISFVLNDFDQKQNYGYGYRYGSYKNIGGYMLSDHSQHNDYVDDTPPKKRKILAPFRKKPK